MKRLLGFVDLTFIIIFFLFQISVLAIASIKPEVQIVEKTVEREMVNTKLRVVPLKIIFIICYGEYETIPDEKKKFEYVSFGGGMKYSKHSAAEAILHLFRIPEPELVCHDGECGGYSVSYYGSWDEEGILLDNYTGDTSNRWNRILIYDVSSERPQRLLDQKLHGDCKVRFLTKQVGDVFSFKDVEVIYDVF